MSLRLTANTTRKQIEAATKAELVGTISRVHVAYDLGRGLSGKSKGELTEIAENLVKRIQCGDSNPDDRD